MHTLTNKPILEWGLLSENDFNQFCFFKIQSRIRTYISNHKGKGDKRKEREEEIISILSK